MTVFRVAIHHSTLPRPSVSLRHLPDLILLLTSWEGRRRDGYVHFSHDAIDGGARSMCGRRFFFFLGRPYILYDRLLLLLYVGQRERDVSYYYSCRIIVSLIGTWTGPSRNRSQRKRRSTFLYVNSIHGHPSSFNSRSFFFVPPLFWDDGKETSVSLNRWKMSKMKSSRGHRSASKAAASR